MGAGGLWNACWRALGSVRSRALVKVVVLVLGGQLAASCGEDKEDPAPMEEGECVNGTVRTCDDNGCSIGSRVCTNGQYGPCLCAQGTGGMGGGMSGSGGSGMADASIQDASMATDGAQTMPDGSDEPEPDASEPDGEEDCDNGRDDDGDGDVDCADDACGRSTCVPEAPDDFEGPFLTFIGGSDAPSCGGAYGEAGPSGGAGLVAPAADCTTCTCDAGGTNACAAFVNLEAGGNNSCSGGCSNTLAEEACATNDWACIAGDPTANVRAVLPDSAGTCTPSEQDPEIDPATFAQHARSCAPDRQLERDGCSRDELCAPRTPFDGVYCVSREGEHDCPDGGYSERYVFYGDIEDDRACSDCECERDCEYTIELFGAADTMCMGSAVTTLSIDSPSESEAQSSCEDAPVGAGNTLHAALTIDGSGACAASGGDAQGNANGTDPITFCCLD